MSSLNPRARAQFDAARERVYATGFHALAEGNAALARNAFGLLAAMSPLDERPWLGLGAAQEQMGDWQLAAVFYRWGQNVAPRSAWPLLGEARALGKLGHSQSAEALLDRAESLTDETAIIAHIETMRGAL